jgi:hypothetical protein
MASADGDRTGTEPMPMSPTAQRCTASSAPSSTATTAPATA